MLLSKIFKKKKSPTNEVLAFTHLLGTLLDSDSLSWGNSYKRISPYFTKRIVLNGYLHLVLS